MEKLTVNGDTYQKVSSKKINQPSRPLPFSVGDKVFIRTVTLYYTGVITNITGNWITLADAAWIADTGRFNNFLVDGKCNEYEGFPSGVHIPLGSIVDISPWAHTLFSGHK